MCPEVVLDFPEQVENLHRDFLRAGSDVIEAFTYYAHREKLRLIGRENDLEPMNRQALAIAKKVAAEGDALVAGNICNTNIYEPNNKDAARQVRAMFEEQVGWAVDAGVDFVVAETISWLGEAEIALDVIRQTKLPSVVTFALHRQGELRDKVSAPEGAKKIEQLGADVVGLNCIRGIRTMMPYVQADPRRGEDPCGGAAGAVSDHDRRADLRVADREGRRVRALHSGPALVPGGARSVPGDALRDRRVRPRGAGDGRELCRRLLRRRTASHPRARRSARTAAGGEPLLARHVEALCVRQRRAAEAGEPGIRREAVAGSPCKILITLVFDEAFERAENCGIRPAKTEWVNPRGRAIGWREDLHVRNH